MAYVLAWEGLGGRIKVQPEDFIVEELWNDRVVTVDYSIFQALKDLLQSKIHEPKDFLHFTLIKRNWDTVKALRYMGFQLKCSLKRFGFAGQKDKRALTAQRVSVWKKKIPELRKVRLKDLKLKDFTYAEEPITLGSSTGNRFTVTIREIPKTRREIKRTLKAFYRRIDEGIPNFYGEQRLGKGDDNALVGKAIIEGNLKGAVEILLRKVKSYVDCGRTAEIPDVFWIEKRVLRHLEKLPNDYAGALRKIPKKIRRIFTHAYQSKIFNDRLLAFLIKGNCPETIEIEGFDIPWMPELSCKTIKRNSFMTVRDFEILKVEDGSVTIRFKLNKGEYASVLLEELIQGDWRT